MVLNHKHQIKVLRVTKGRERQRVNKVHKDRQVLLGDQKVIRVQEGLRVHKDRKGPKLLEERQVLQAHKDRQVRIKVIKVLKVREVDKVNKDLQVINLDKVHKDLKGL